MTHRTTKQTIPYLPRCYPFWSATARRARRLDRTVAFGLEQWQRESAPSDAVTRTLAALPTEAVNRLGQVSKASARRLIARRWGIRGVGLAMTGVLTGLWWQWLNIVPPDYAGPTPPLPHLLAPNAHTFYVQAANRIQNPHAVQQALRGPQTPDIKPHVVFDSEGGRMEGQPDAMRVGNGGGSDRAARLAENADVLRKLRQGFAFSYRTPPVVWPNANLGYLNQFRSLAALLRLEAQQRAALGDWNGAVQSSLDAIRLGEDVQRGAVVIGYVNGDTLEAYGQTDLWRYIAHLNAAQARRAAGTLQTLHDRHAPLPETIAEEARVTQTYLRTMMRSSAWRFHFASDWEARLEGEARLPSGADLGSFLVLCRYSNRQILHNLAAYSQALVSRSGLAYPLSRSLPPLPEPTDPVIQLMLGGYQGVLFFDSQAQTQNVLLMTTLALRAYRVEHRGWPDTLSALCPGILAHPPADPFRPDHALGYRREGEQYVLYSVGPDGKDDGGQPIDARRDQPASAADPAAVVNPATSHSWVSDRSVSHRWDVRSDSQGDIVANHNTRW